MYFNTCNGKVFQVGASSAPEVEAAAAALVTALQTAAPASQQPTLLGCRTTAGGQPSNNKGRHSVQAVKERGTCSPQAAADTGCVSPAHPINQTQQSRAAQTRQAVYHGIDSPAEVSHLQQFKTARRSGRAHRTFPAILKPAILKECIAAPLWPAQHTTKGDWPRRHGDRPAKGLDRGLRPESLNPEPQQQPQQGQACR